MGKNDWIEGFKHGRSSERSKEVNLVDFKNFKVGASVCSEVMSVSINRDIVNRGSGVLINLASSSLFNGSKAMYDQTINMAKVRAVENNRYYIQSSNFVPSFIIDNQGKLIKQSNWYEESIIFEDIKIINKNSIYNKVGRFILPVFLILIVIIGLVDMKKLKLFFGQENKK